MRYYEEMQSKYGFSDGNAIPDGIELYRTAYIRTMNKLLGKHGSRFRLAAFDRAGLHNWCMLFTVPLEEFETIKDPEVYVDHKFSTEEPVPDNAYIEALSEAHELMVDDYVMVCVELDEARLGGMLESI